MRATRLCRKRLFVPTLTKKCLKWKPQVGQQWSRANKCILRASKSVMLNQDQTNKKKKKMKEEESAQTHAIE